MAEEWIYEHAADGSARFVLGTVGANPLVCFGINPSTAKPGAPDTWLSLHATDNPERGRLRRLRLDDCGGTHDQYGVHTSAIVGETRPQHAYPSQNQD